MRMTVWIWGLAWCFSASAQVYLKPEEALKIHFPKAQISKETLLLSSDEAEKITQIAKESFSERMVPIFWVKENAKPLASGVVLSRKIKHQNQTALYLIDSSGKLLSIELVSFAEPIEYQPKAEWFAQFKGLKATEAPPQLGENVRVVTGSTLTAQSFLSGTRLAFAIWKVRLSSGPEAP